jgi:hypothetical protein
LTGVAADVFICDESATTCKEALFLKREENQIDSCMVISFRKNRVGF